MKKRAIIVVSLALASGALLLWLLFSRPHAGASLTLVQYTQWPHGATLRLSNSTRQTIACVAEPTLCFEKTPNGWTNISLGVRSMTAFDPNNGKSKEYFYVPESTRQPFTLPIRELKPGQSLQFWVRLEPGGLPKRVGTVYRVLPGKLESKLRPWLDRIRSWVRLKPASTFPANVWCEKPLSAPLSQSVGL